MARKDIKYKLKYLTDHEWTCVVPDEMLDVYMSVPDTWDDSTKEYRSIPQKFTDEELDEFKRLYPEWWVIKE